MPHSGGRIYTETTGGVTYGVSIRDIQETIGYYSSYVHKLFTSDSINPYAKFKPVRHVSLGPMGRYASYPYWYRGDDNKCGLNLTRLGWQDITRANIAAATNWRETNVGTNRELPRGPQTYHEYYRVLDMNGYNHGEVCPLQAFAFPDTIYENVDLEALYITSAAGRHSSATQITAYDLMQYFSLNKSVIEADTTTFGYFGLIVIGEGTEGEIAYFKSINRNSVEDGYGIDLDWTALLARAEQDGLARPFSYQSQILLAPCLCNMSTDNTWQYAAGWDADLQVILWPSELGAYRMYAVSRKSISPTEDPYYRIVLTITPDSVGPGSYAYVTVRVTETSDGRQVHHGARPNITLFYDRIRKVNNTTRVYKNDASTGWTQDDTSIVRQTDENGQYYWEKTFSFQWNQLNMTGAPFNAVIGFYPEITPYGGSEPMNTHLIIEGDSGIQCA